MKILLLHQYFLEENDSGGSRWNEMTKVWTDAGHEVVVLAGMIHANGSEKRAEYKGKHFVRKIQGKCNRLALPCFGIVQQKFYREAVGLFFFHVFCYVGGAV